MLSHFSVFLLLRVYFFRPVHQVPNVKYPILRYKARNFVKIGIDETRLRGRKVLVPQKVTVKLEKLIPFNVVADSEEFKVSVSVSQSVEIKLTHLAN